MDYSVVIKGLPRRQDSDGYSIRTQLKKTLEENLNVTVRQVSCVYDTEEYTKVYKKMRADKTELSKCLYRQTEGLLKDTLPETLAENETKMETLSKEIGDGIDLLKLIEESMDGKLST